MPARDQILFGAVPADLREVKVGASRIAGPPDLPLGTIWPTDDEGRLLPLVLQLRLEDVAAFAAAARLPRSGNLYFFGAPVVSTDEDDHENIPAAIVYAPPGSLLVRGAMPPESTDEDYWDTTSIARIVDWREHAAADEPNDDDTHVLFPVGKVSSSYGLIPPDGGVALLEMRSDYAIGMNWGDAAWATWVVPAGDLAAGRFDRSYGHCWIG